jgi:hypothetical protein
MRSLVIREQEAKTRKAESEADTAAAIHMATMREFAKLYGPHSVPKQPEPLPPRQLFPSKEP